ncbi:MAG: RHS repeat-associated core domain-containing protein, partial [Verrucomicrobia bacterium]
TLFIYDAWNCITEYQFHNSSFSLHTSYLWGMDLSGTMQGAGLPVKASATAGGVGGLLSQRTTNGAPAVIHYPCYDGNGNITQYLTSTGSIAAHFEYDPFGNTVVNTDTTNQFAHRFSTKPLDQPTGLYYYGYRYYDPTTGRWPSRDPIGEEGGGNLYGFVGNDGFNRWDILGLDDPPSYIEGITDECKAREAADKNAKNKHDADAAMKKWEKNHGKRKTGWGKNTKRFLKKAGKFGVKKIPVIGWGLAAEGAYSGYQDGGFWGGVNGLLW